MKDEMEKRRRLTLKVFLLILAACPAAAWACEPILPLMELFAGQAMLASYVALPIVVAVKVVLFVFFERRLPWFSATVFLVLGNVLSTVIGFLLIVAAASPMLLLFILPLVFAVSLEPSRRLRRFKPWGLFGGMSAASISALVTFLYFSTFVLFFVSQGILGDEGGGTLGYWGFKLAYVYAGLAVSLFLTAAWEEAVVGFLARRRVERPFFLPTVLRANLYTFLLVFAYAAIEVLPRRLAAPGFLIGWVTGLW